MKYLRSIIMSVVITTNPEMVALVMALQVVALILSIKFNAYKQQAMKKLVAIAFILVLASCSVQRHDFRKPITKKQQRQLTRLHGSGIPVKVLPWEAVR